MKAASHDLRVTTDDGSYGVHGFVTDVLRKILDEQKRCEIDRGDWSCAHDEVFMQVDKGIWGQDDGEFESHHGGCNRNVRGMPGHGGR